MIRKIFLLSLLISSAACADQIKILGTTGLTRAVANLKEAQVIVTAQKPLAVTTLSLQNIDGLKPQESAKADENGVFKFESVPDGTWKIVGRGMKILDVKIIAR